MTSRNFGKVLCAGLVALAVSTAANAAIFEYEWAGGATPILDVGQTADVNVYLTLTQLSTPPFTPDEMGFFLYVLSDFSFNNTSGHIVGPASYGGPLAPDYGYTDIPFPPPTGLTGTQIVYEGPGPIMTQASTGGERFLASTITIEALECPDTPGVADDVFVFIGDPASDLAMFRGDLITAVPVTNNTPTGLSMTNTCIPEPVSLTLVALGGLAMIRRRR